MSLGQLLNKDLDFKMPLGNVNTVKDSLISGQSNFSDCTALSNNGRKIPPLT